MAVAIFPNSSYFIALGGSPDFFEQIRLASLRHQARIYACRSRSEFLEALGIVRTPSGLFLDGNGLSGKDLKEIVPVVTSLRVSPAWFVSQYPNKDFGSISHVRCSSLASGADAEKWRTEIDRFMNGLIPPKLDQIILDCANSIVPRFLPEVKNFKSVSHAMLDADYVLNFSISAGDVIGQFMAWIQWDDIRKMFPDSSDPSGQKVLDILKESMNQCAGVLVQSILRLHPNCKMKIGLSTGFDLLKIPKIESIKHFPSAHILEEGGRLGISVGFIDLRHQPIFDLSGYTPAESEGDIEFL